MPETGLKLTKFAAAAAVLAFALGGAGNTSAADDKMTFTSFGGSFQEAQRKALLEPFSKQTGIAVVEDEWSGEMAKLRAMVESGNVSWDVLDLSDGQLPLACDEGLLEELDPSDYGGESNFMEGWTHPCGVGAVVSSIVIGYDDRAFEGEKPSTLADFWDLEKFPGKRAMRKWPKHNLEFALLADGVPPEDVYQVLSTSEGVDRALSKLDEIKEQVVWFANWAQPGQLLADGEVVMSTGTNGRLAVASQSTPDIKFFWDRQAYAGDMYAIVKGAPNRDAAVEFIRFATKPENAARIVQYIPYAPPIPGAMESIDADTAANLPTADANLSTAWRVDSRFWGDHMEDMEIRFQSWLAQ